MFFVLSKIFWMLVQPVSLSVLLLLGGIVLSIRRHRRSGLVLGGMGTAILVLGGYTTLGAMLIQPLEARFVRPASIEGPIGTIVALGGSTSGKISTARGLTELNMGGDRLVEALRLAQLYPEARILLTGGTGTILDEGEPEAQSASRLLQSLGVAADRLIIEDNSRNTDENAILSKPLIEQGGGQTILVTSAFHMPRSVGLFRKQGIEVVPWPTDYRSAGNENFALDFSFPTTNLDTTGVAIREWIGLLVYHWTGRIDDVFPAQASN